MKLISGILLLSDDQLTQDSERRTVWRKLPKLAKIDFQTACYGKFSEFWYFEENTAVVKAYSSNLSGPLGFEKQPHVKKDDHGTVNPRLSS